MLAGASDTQQCDVISWLSMRICWNTGRKDPKEVKLAQERRLERNKKWLDGDHRTPRKVAMAYYHDIGFDVHKLVDEIDWAFFEGIEYNSDDDE